MISWRKYLRKTTGMIKELEGLLYKEIFNLITETEDLCKCLRKLINTGM